MTDLIASYIVRGINLFFHVMPIRFNLWLGRRFGALIFLLSGRRSRVTYSNLKAAFHAEKPPAELKALTKKVYYNMAQTFAEILSMTKMDKAYIEKYVNVVNFPRAFECLKNPNGMILLSAHFGNWELSTVTASMKNIKMYLLARDQKMKRLNELLNLLRESRGNVVIRKGADIKNIFRVLREGKCVGILADQNAGDGGILLDLFGRPASTAPGPYRIAEKCGALILPAFIHRVKGPYHELVLEEIMVVKKGESAETYARQYNRLLEKHIRAHPEQWLWMHKKWKKTDLKKIMVLDDGKKGHLKQSLAAVEAIKKYRRDKGFAPEKTPVGIVRTEFRSRAAKILFNAAAPFFGPRCQGCLKCLERALTPESFRNAAVDNYADVIVSCGSALAGVNKILKAEYYCKNLVILDPGVLNRRSFDAVVIPDHDIGKKIARGENIIVTELAPNLADREELELLRGSLKREKAGTFRGGQSAGVLIGGDNDHFKFTERTARAAAEDIKFLSGRLKGATRITTSRRTPLDAENIFRQAFGSDTGAFEFISGRDDRDERTVEKILALSDVLMVSGESISMVSEAVSSGKPVYVFMPEKIRSGRTKYERFASSLAEKGYIKIFKAGDIAGSFPDIGVPTSTEVFPDDKKRIYDKIHKLF